MKQTKIKATPLRMCIVCKQMKPKTELFRIVVDKDENVFIDLTGKANGRGAYICNERTCMETCVKKRILNRAFKRELSGDLYDKIAEEYEKSSRQ